MRIALLAPEIPDYCLELAETVAESCDVLLCIADKHQRERVPHSRPGLEIAWQRWPRQRDARSAGFTFRLMQKVREWKPDVIHILNETNIWLNGFVIMPKFAPVITTMHDVRLHPGDSMTGRIPRYFPNLLARRSDAVIVHGERLRDDAVASLSISRDRVFVVPHPPLRYFFEIAQEKDFKKPNDGVFRVLFYGRIHEYKGLRYLLEAASSLRKSISNFRLVIAGRGDDFSLYRPYIDDPRVIELHNHFISDTDTAKLFAAADVLALPYVEASQSGVLMIALPFGLPVVATDVGEIGTAVRSLGIGAAIPPRNVQLLASTILRLATDPDCRRTYARNAAFAMDRTFSRRALSGQLTAVYQEVIDRQRRRWKTPV